MPDSGQTAMVGVATAAALALIVALLSQNLTKHNHPAKETQREKKHFVTNEMAKHDHTHEVCKKTQKSSYK